MTLPQTLDAGDCITFDRDLALQATSHILIAMKLLLEVSPSGISSIWIWLISTSAKCSAVITGETSLMSWCMPCSSRRGSMAKPEVPTGPIQIDGKPEPVSIRSIKGAIASLRKVDLEMLQTLIEQKEWKRAINALNAISAKAKKVQSAAGRMASRAAKQHWSPLLEETPMAERSLRTRLKDSSGSGRNYAKALHWGIRWEDLRSAWFSRCGRWADADEALARQHRLEREYVDEVGVPFHG